MELDDERRRAGSVMRVGRGSWAPLIVSTLVVLGACGTGEVQPATSMSAETVRERISPCGLPPGDEVASVSDAFDQRFASTWIRVRGAVEVDGERRFGSDFGRVDLASADVEVLRGEAPESVMAQAVAVPADALAVFLEQGGSVYFGLKDGDQLPDFLPSLFAVVTAWADADGQVALGGLCADQDWGEQWAALVEMAGGAPEAVLAELAAGGALALPEPSPPADSGNRVRGMSPDGLMEGMVDVEFEVVLPDASGVLCPRQGELWLLCVDMRADDPGAAVLSVLTVEPGVPVEFVILDVSGDRSTASEPVAEVPGVEVSPDQAPPRLVVDLAGAEIGRGRAVGVSAVWVDAG